MKHSGPIYAVLAALLYALNTPMSKIFLSSISAEMMAAFLYLGAGTGMFLVHLLTGNRSVEAILTKKDLPYTVLMVILDIAAPVLMMKGLEISSAANASLLNNFEIVATTLIAALVFHEQVRKKLRIAIILIVSASAILSFGSDGALEFSRGSLFVILACSCWGLENNCTRMLSSKSPQEIVIVKGLGSGTGAFLVAIICQAPFPSLALVPCVMVLGFASYGLSVFFYVLAQRYLGAARTSAYYSLSPFIGSALSFIILHESLSLAYILALAIMIAGTALTTSDVKDEETLGS